MVRRDPEPHQTERDRQSVDHVNRDAATQLRFFLLANENGGESHKRQAIDLVAVGQWYNICVF